MAAINRVVYRFWHNRSRAGRVGYIGKDKYHPSRFNLKVRAKETYCSKLYAALKKYPLRFWRKEVLAFGFRTDAALSKAETSYIRAFDSRRKGYNCTDGGGGMVGWSASVITRKRMSRAHKGRGVGRKLSIEIRHKMSQSHRGFRHTEEAKRKISKARRRLEAMKRKSCAR